MDLPLADRRALVFGGGGKGVGLAAACQLALEGAHVTIAARTEAVLRDAAALLSREVWRKVRRMVADLTQDEGRSNACRAVPCRAVPCHGPPSS